MPEGATGLVVAMAAGGTAGHVEPALNVADVLRERDATTRIVVIGSERGLESELVPARGYELRTVPAVPMPRRPSVDLLLLAPRLGGAVTAAGRHLDDIGADIVVGFGGYAAVPAMLAGRRRRLPLVAHEANARPGIANRLAATLGASMFEVVPGTIRGAQVVGMPLRRVIADLDRAAKRIPARAELGLPADGPVLLVFGGSQGAHSLNRALAGALAALTAAGVTVLHAYGSRNEPVAPAGTAGYIGVPYLTRMDLAYSGADLALCRAGAMTCAELAAVGLPGIYVPLPIGNGEQRLNALPVVRSGGGVLVDDSDLSAEWLGAQAPALLHDGPRLAAMAAAAHAHGVRDGASRLAAHIERIAGRTT